MIPRLKKRSFGVLRSGVGATKDRFSVLGFTVLEMVIVLAILIVISVVAISPFDQFRQTKLLIDSTEMVKSTFETAQSKTRASAEGDRYGVYILEDELVLFSGSEYDPEDSSVRTVSLPDGVLVSEVDLVSETDRVVFERLTGEPDNFGTLTVSLASDPDKKRLVNIMSGGMIETSSYEE